MYVRLHKCTPRTNLAILALLADPKSVKSACAGYWLVQLEGNVVGVAFEANLRLKKGWTCMIRRHTVVRVCVRTTGQEFLGFYHREVASNILNVLPRVSFR